ncbi:hypothetical protein [Kineococcus sp. NPDC059986]|uniref:hypothetical protein n=1 Tax=Kineococcus sp. NPDC059986 TaxID=3155538 RepID=UPI00344D14F0
MTSAFVVRYADETCTLREGQRRRFGRSDAEDDITVWEQVRGNTLSVTAGELWCTDGQVWVRNLSSAHELVVDGPGVVSTVLPPRDPDRPGHACSVPWPRGSVHAPSTGSWRLLIAPDDRRSTSETPEPVPAEPAAAPPRRIPADLDPVARAVCAPVLAGRREGADAGEVAGVLGLPRRDVERDLARLADLLGLDDPTGVDGPELARVLLASPVLGTVRVPDVPAQHRDVAEAVCAPLLRGAPGPATYAEVAAVLGVSARTARRRVEALVEEYADTVRALPGGVRPQDTLTAAVARLLVHRGKLQGAVGG